MNAETMAESYSNGQPPLGMMPDMQQNEPQMEHKSSRERDREHRDRKDRKHRDHDRKITSRDRDRKRRSRSGSKSRRRYILNSTVPDIIMIFCWSH